MSILDEIDMISKIKVATKVKNDENICKSLLYTIYHTLELYPQVFENNETTIKTIKTALHKNYLLINEGADLMITFYYLNTEKVRDDNFGNFMQIFLKFVDETKKELGEYTLINIYDMAIEKIDNYFINKERR